MRDIQKRKQTMLKLIPGVLALGVLVAGFLYFPLPTKLTIQIAVTWGVFDLITSSETSSMTQRAGIRKKATVGALATGIIAGAFLFFPRYTCIGSILLLHLAVVALLIREPATAE